MLNILVAFLAAAASGGAAALLGMCAYRERRPHQILWTVTTGALVLASVGILAGSVAGFNGVLFRMIEFTAALVAPMSLGAGLVESVARTVAARFATRLIAISFAVIAMVVVVLDPLDGSFDKSLPIVSVHYSVLPRYLLDIAHLFAVVTLVCCLVVTALRARGGERDAGGPLLTSGAMALAGVLILASVRDYLPSAMAILLLGGSAALVWYGALRLPDSELPAFLGRRDDDAKESDEMYDDDYAPRDSRERAGATTLGPGPFGQVTMYSLHEGSEATFDRIMEQMVRHVRGNEPGAIVYSSHTVIDAPRERICYQLFRDEEAFEEHLRQRYVQWFADQIVDHVASTNNVEMSMNAAMVAPMPRSAEPVPARGPQSAPPTRTVASGPGGSGGPGRGAVPGARAGAGGRSFPPGAPQGGSNGRSGPPAPGGRPIPEGGRPSPQGGRSGSPAGPNPQAGRPGAPGAPGGAGGQRRFPPQAPAPRPQGGQGGGYGGAFPSRGPADSQGRQGNVRWGNDGR